MLVKPEGNLSIDVRHIIASIFDFKPYFIFNKYEIMSGAGHFIFIEKLRKYLPSSFLYSGDSTNPFLTKYSFVNPKT